MAKTIMVTGAAGLLGAEITGRLAGAGHPVVALTHTYSGPLIRNDGTVIATDEASAAPGPGRVVRIRGDVALPRLGLSDRHHANVLGTVDTVVHCAAVTRFDLPPEAYQTVNVEGSQRVLDLIGTAGASLVQVSTAYVCGERDGRAGEEELDVGQRFGNLYEQSKLRSERLCRLAADAGMPVAVLRPSIVVGDQRTGAIRDLTNLYQLLKVVTDGRLRTLPGRYDAQLDLVPVDRVADMAVHLAIRMPGRAGSTVHAVGHQVSLRELSGVLAEYPAFHVPQLLPPAGFDPAGLSPAQRRYYRVAGERYAPYLRRRVWFDDTHARLIGFPRPTGTTAFLRRLFDHGLQTGFFGSSAARVGARDMAAR